MFAATDHGETMSMLNDWVRDLRHAGRTLRRTHGFTAVAVGTLALAIGANAGMFSVVDKVLLRPLPYANADRLTQILGTAPGTQLTGEFALSPEFFVHYREESKLLEDAANYNSGTSTLRVGDRVERVLMSFHSYTLFTTLGAKPILGRTPLASDESRVAVISHSLWQTWFGGDSTVIGRTYSISGANREIIGVMGPEFRFPSDGVLVWVSSDIRTTGITPGRFGFNLLVARMKPGVTHEALAAELTTLSKRLPERFGGSADYARIIERHRAVVRSLESAMLGDVAAPLWVLLAAVGGVLIIACANVANLFLVRAEGRQREMAVRRAIGAGRGQLVRLQLAESLVVAGLAGALAIVLAKVTMPLFLAAAPAGVPRIGDVRVDGTTMFFTFGAALVAALVSGLVPAYRASAPNLMRLREGGRGSTGRRHWARDGLVVAQTALALVLLISSGLLVRSFTKLGDVDPGYDKSDIFTFQFAPEQPQLTDGPSWARFHLAFMDRLRALPGVQTVGIVENMPLDEGTASFRYRPAEQSESATGSLMRTTFAAPDYFEAMGVKVLAGRPFTIDDNISTPGNVVISRTAANQLWPGEDPIGRRLIGDGITEVQTVVGVVADVLQQDFREQPQGLVYYPMVGATPASWRLTSPAYVIKTPRAATIAPEVRALVKEVAPEAPMYRTYTVTELAERSMIGLRFTMLTLGIASVLALILGAVGLYGVLSYVVAERTREIGVRMALGAKAGEVRRMVVAQGARVVAVGVVIGVVAALASTRALGSFLFGVGTMDATTFVGMSASMVLVGMLASYVPARRASNVDPIESLRGE